MPTHQDNVETNENLWRGSLLPLGRAAAPKRDGYTVQREQAPSPRARCRVNVVLP
jgi:hypothetical protein